MSDASDPARPDVNVLLAVAQRLGETLELDTLLHSIEHAGRSALGCERATVFLYDDAADELYSRVATGAEEIRFSARLGIAGEAARSREVIVVPDAYADPRFNREIDKQTGYRTRNLLTLPLVTPEGELMGVLQVLNKLSGDFNDRDEVIARALSSLTGVALKRQMLLDEAAEKQRLERDLKIARQIQQQFLPRENPRVADFDVAGWNQPADETGGDCYDFHQPDANRLAVMIADATGHGIGPALIVAQCRSLIRALTDTSDDIASIAGRVNNLLCHDLPDDRFVTTCFGILDVSRARLTYVSAGHGPLLLYRADTGRVESYHATAIPMGIMPGVEIALAPPIDFAPGDLFILLTDGFSEWARPDGQQYGEQRLANVICRHHEQPCAELIQTIYADVRRFAENTSQPDDLTAILIKRT